jgi:hypothetical protein
MSAPLFKKVNSSDYITYKKRIAIASEYAHTADTNPIKNNKKQYNRNFMFVPTITTPTTDASNCLIQSKNYELLQDYTSGANYLQVICDLSWNV